MSIRTTPDATFTCIRDAHIDVRPASTCTPVTLAWLLPGILRQGTQV
jgi:hypothetical protein